MGDADDCVDAAVDVVEGNVLKMRLIRQVAFGGGNVGRYRRQVVYDGIVYLAAIASVVRFDLKIGQLFVLSFWSMNGCRCYRLITKFQAESTSCCAGEEVSITSSVQQRVDLHELAGFDVFNLESDDRANMMVVTVDGSASQ